MTTRGTRTEELGVHRPPDRSRRVTVAALVCGLLVAGAGACGRSSTADSSSSASTATNTSAKGPGYAARLNALCADLLVEVLAADGGGHPGHFPIAAYEAQRPRLEALVAQFDARADAVPTTDADQAAAAAFEAFRRLSDRATAMLDAAAATGRQKRFDRTFGRVHRMLDDSSVPETLLAQGIACNGR